MKKNKFALVFDRSSSMSSFKRDALKTLNDNIQSIKAGQSQFKDQTSTITIVTFADTVETVRRDIPSELIVELRDSEYQPYGNTALLDGVRKAVDELQESLDASDPDCSFVICAITDGEENASKFMNGKSFSQLLKDKDSDGRWTFAFLVPKYKKAPFVSRFGLPEGNVSEWETTSAGIKEMSTKLISSVDTYYQNRSTGAKTTSTFFADLKNVSADVLKDELIDVTNNVQIMHPVADEDGMQIRDFAKSRSINYTPGVLYYMLMKSEKVQEQKKLLIRDVTSGKFYAGSKARKLVGLPSTYCRLRPGNLNGYEVYIESTSYNRKVKRGMKMVHKVL